MEDTLLSRSDNIKEVEDMTLCLNSMVVIDWVDAIGSAPLVEHIHHSGPSIASSAGLHQQLHLYLPQPDPRWLLADC